MITHRAGRFYLLLVKTRATGQIEQRPVPIEPAELALPSCLVELVSPPRRAGSGLAGVGAGAGAGATGVAAFCTPRERHTTQTGGEARRVGHRRDTVTAEPRRLHMSRCTGRPPGRVSPTERYGPWTLPTARAAPVGRARDLPAGPIAPRSRPRHEHVARTASRTVWQVTSRGVSRDVTRP